MRSGEPALTRRQLREQRQARRRRLISMIVAPVIAVGGIVGIGIWGAAPVVAAVIGPQVSTSGSLVVAGQDASISVSFSNPIEAPPGDDLGLYNLSGGLVIPDGVTIQGGFGALGNPAKQYTNEDGALPGVYSLSPEQCEAMGLEAGPGFGTCQVPEGMQYLVFMNISDLPAGARNGASLTVRPNSSVDDPDLPLYEPGSEIPFTFSGFTSFNANLNPMFPGSTSVALDGAHSSAPGISPDVIRVEALSISKSEPSAENELLRGVHENQTVYTLRVRHTNQGDVGPAGGVGSIKVIDYLPASLEYLGSGLVDNTQNANGNADVMEEYPGSGPLDVAGTAPANWQLEESIETVSLDAAQAAALGLAPGVYTKVTWDLGLLEADPLGAQSYPTTPGTPGEIVIQYRAGIPLFENTMDFVGEAPTPESLMQGANLDNNTGPSTRHGRNGDPWQASGITNTAFVEGDYERIRPLDPEEPDQLLHTSRARGSETVEALDVRLLKSVNQSFFQQNGLALYTLNIATSEYVEASLGDTPAQRPNRLVDDFGDGLCPVFPADVPITPGASTHGGIPNLVIGDPTPGGTILQNNMTAEDWAGSAGFPIACTWPSTVPAATLNMTDGDGNPLPDGVTLTGIAYNPGNGHFFLDLQIADMGANETVRVNYSALQMTHYNHVGGSGGTSSGDLVRNGAEVLMSTTPAPDTDANEPSGQSVGGEMRAYDDSSADLRSTVSQLKKFVLPRSAGPVAAADIAAVPASAWEDIQAPEPFIVGDEVWYKITLTPPTNIEVRNAVLDDILPVGTKIAPVPGEDPGDSPLERTLVLGENYVVVTGSLNGASGCSAELDPASWITKYVPTPGQLSPGSRRISWELGSVDCVANSNRYLPINSTLEFYIKTVIIDSEAFGTVDNPQNLAKYRQEGIIAETTTEIFFDRDDALVEVVSGARLVKGIARNMFAGIDGQAADGWRGADGAPAPDYPAGSNHEALLGMDNFFGSDIDGEWAVQNDEITFRIDVTAPLGNSVASVPTSKYLIWDALPAGVTKADIVDVGLSAPRATHYHEWVEDIADPGDPAEWQHFFTETSLDDFDYEWLDPGDVGYDDLNLNDDYDGRTILVWTVNEIIPGSVGAATDDPSTEVTNGFSLFYTLRVPSAPPVGETPLLLQEFENTASIIEFGAINSTTSETSATLVPVGPDTMRDNGTEAEVEAAGKYPMPSDYTLDTSGFQLPNASMRKLLHTTEILTADDANNSFDQVVQGEYITYRYTARIPANTTVHEGLLFDEGQLRRTAGGSLAPNPMQYHFHEATFLDAPFGTDVVDTDPVDHDPDIFVFNEKTGALFFPEYYQTGDDAEEFTVELVVWIDAVDEANPTQAIDRPTIGHGTVLENTARFQSTNVDGTDNEFEAREDVEYVDPQLQVVKSADPRTIVNIDSIITYTIEVRNPGNRPISYDNTVVDTVPAGIIVDPNSFRVGTTNSYGSAAPIDAGIDVSDEARFDGAGVATGDGGTITWSYERTAALEEVPTSVYLFYQAKISPQTAGGRGYTNEVTVTGYTLPAVPDTADRRGVRTADDDEVITAATARIAKGVRLDSNPGVPDPDAAYSAAVSSPNGPTVEYRLVVTLEPYINYYNVEIRDVFSGSSIGTPTRTIVSGPSDAPASSVGGSWIATPVSGTAGLTTTWTHNNSDNEPHIESADVERTLTIIYEVPLTASITGTQLRNTGTFSWTESEDPGSDRHSTDPAGVANVNILTPQANVAKSVRTLGAPAGNGSFGSSASGEVDQNFEFRLRVSAATGATRSAAYNVTVTDVLPAGVVLDETSFRIGGAAVLAPDSVTYNPGNRTITLFLAGPINTGGGNARDLTYEAKFENTAALAAGAKQNTARVESYESWPTGGRAFGPRSQVTANITPEFPSVTLLKTVSADNPANPATNVAFAGEPFAWTLRATNGGAGDVQEIELRDELPANWDYDDDPARSPQIRLNIGGATGTWVALGDPTDQGTSNPYWTEAQIRSALEAGGLTAGAPVIPGRVGSNPSSSIEIRFSTIPTAAALLDAGVTSPDGTVRPEHTNTLTATAKDRNGHDRNAGGEYSPGNSPANAFIHSSDLQITKSSGEVLAGTTVTGWTLTVRNNGPDPAAGPIVVSDLTGVLPAGVTVNSASGTGWVCDPVTTTDGEASFTCTRAAALASGASAPPINVNVTIAANVPDGTTATNEADVTGPTYDRDDTNNEDDGTITVRARADLAIVKTVNTADPHAGGSITWQLSPSNLGPSVSWVDDSNPITIVDTVPEGVVDVGDPSVDPVGGSAGWIAAVISGGNPSVFPAQPGDVITWTYIPPTATPAWMPVGAAPTILLTGSIPPSWVPTAENDGEIVNTAEISRGLTPDPVDPNNTSTVPADISNDTTLDMTKTRVVNDGGTWRLAEAEDPVPVAGETISYLFHVTNTGPADAQDVTVTDTRPSGLLANPAVIDISPATWSHVTDVFSLTNAPSGTLPVGTTYSFIATYTIASGHTGDIENCAVADATNSTNQPGDCDNSSTTQHIDVSIVKSHTLPAADVPATAGGTITYQLVVTSEGPSDATAPITVTDTLPAGLSYGGTATVQIGSGAATPFAPTVDDSGARHTLTWTNLTAGATLPVGQSITITFVADIDSSLRAQANVVNDAVVSAPGDTDPANNSSSDPVDLITRAEMTIDKLVQDDDGNWVETAEKSSGSVVTWRVTINNPGPSDASNVTFTDALPAGLSLISIEQVSGGSGWNCPVVPTGSCSYTGDYPVGTTTVLEITSLAAANLDATIVPLVNTGTIAWTDDTVVGPRTAEDTASITLRTDADLGIEKNVITGAGGTVITAPAEVVAGETAWYRLQVTNHGPSDAAGPVTVVDTLPLGVTAVQTSHTTINGWTMTPGPITPGVAQTVTFTLAGGLTAATTDDPERGLAPVIEFEVNVDPAALALALLTNHADVDSPTPDSNPDNDDDTVQIRIVREADVSIEKGHNAVTPVDEYEVGDLVEFTIVVRNDAGGPSNASGIVVTDTLPLGLEFVSIAGDDWALLVTPPAVDVNGITTVVVSYDEELAPGGETSELTITARVTVDIGDDDSLTNEACVALGAGHTNTGEDDCDTDTITVVPIADLVIVKTVDAASAVAAGEQITWNIAIGNIGPSDSLSSTADPITVVDEVPEGIIDVADPTQGDWTATVTRGGSPSAFPAQPGDVITWTLADGKRIPAGTDPSSDPSDYFVLLTLTGTIDPTWIASGPIGSVGGGSIENIAEVVPGVTRDQDLSNNEDNEIVTPTDDTELEVWKTRMVQVDDDWVPAASLTPVPEFTPGSAITYRLTVANIGNAVARDVQLVDAIPAELSNPRITLIDGQGSWTAASVVPCDVGVDPADVPYPVQDCVTLSLAGPLQLGLLQSRSVLITFDSDPAQDPNSDLINWVQARGSNVPDHPNDEESTLGVPGADLSIVKTAVQSHVLAGGTVDYELLVTNHGPSIARGPIEVTDLLPDGMSYVPGTAQVTIGGVTVDVEPDISTSAGRELLTWEPIALAGSLDVDETILIELQTQLDDETFFDLDGIVNTARVAADDDYDPSNNESDATVIVEPLVTLITTKTAVGEFQVSRPGTFMITVENIGPTRDPGPITVTDDLPTGLSYRDSPGLPADVTVQVTGSTVVWTLVNGLDIDEMVELTLVVNVLPAAFDSVRNDVVVDSPAEKTPDSVLTDFDEIEVKAGPLSGTGAELPVVLGALSVLLILGGGLILVTRRRRGRVDQE